MNSFTPVPASTNAAKPWYAQPWPWLLMLGPFIVVVAGSYTIWLSFAQQDALIVDDYYRQGQAINQDLRRDRAAARLGMAADLRYDARSGRLLGIVSSHGAPYDEALRIRLVHSTLPEKDVTLVAHPDAAGAFNVALPLFEIARWQVLVEDERRDWRLNGVWPWPHQQQVSISAITPARK